METQLDKRIQAVVFDAVGTVIYPSPSVAEAYQKAIETHCGIQTDSNLVRRTITDALHQRSATDDLATDEDAERNFWAELISTLCPSSVGFQACFDDLFEHFARPDNWRCFSDVVDLIPSLHGLGLKVAIASNFDRRLNRVCDGLAELSEVDCRIVSSLVGFRKPAAQFFDAVVNETNVPAANTLMVGDDPVNDIHGAVSSGFQAALIDRNGNCAENLPSGVHVMNSLQQLPGLVAKINAIDTGRA